MSNTINVDGSIVGNNNTQVIGNNNSVSNRQTIHKDRNDKNFLKTIGTIVGIASGIVAIVSGMIAWLK